MLGDVAVIGMELADGALPQPLVQPIDELGQAVARSGFLAHREPRLPVRQRLGHQHVDGGRLEAELGVELAAQAIEAQGDKAGDMLGVPGRRGEAKIYRNNIPIHPEQQEPQDPGAGGIARKIHDEGV
jgi:hypothetical protein